MLILTECREWSRMLLKRQSSLRPLLLAAASRRLRQAGFLFCPGSSPDTPERGLLTTYRRRDSMKIMTILGSPKKKGNTATVLGMFEEIISKDHEIDRVNIRDCDISGCMGCYACQQTPDEPACVQKDDAGSIFERMLKADAVVYATPLYDWSFSAQLKALLDRHLCLVTGYATPAYKSLVEGKKLALLVTCGGPVENNADLIQGNFDRIGDFLKAGSAGKYVVPGCTTPNEMSDQARQVAEQMARDVVA
jgi:multimeric flavodoxin WrbA